jgi:hypothetical protein
MKETPTKSFFDINFNIKYQIYKDNVLSKLHKPSTVLLVLLSMPDDEKSLNYFNNKLILSLIAK